MIVMKYCQLVVQYLYSIHLMLSRVCWYVTSVGTEREAKICCRTSKSCENMQIYSHWISPGSGGPPKWVD